MYHIVCLTKYRKVIVDEKVDKIIKDTCLEIAKRYDIHFLEVGTDLDHVHFLVQSIPMYLPTKVVRVIKSITGREVFAKVPEIKKELWGGEFWSDGYCISTVGKNGTETVISEYVKDQGKDKKYIQIHKDQIKMFDV